MAWSNIRRAVVGAMIEHAAYILGDLLGKLPRRLLAVRGLVGRHSHMQLGNGLTFGRAQIDEVPIEWVP